MKTTTEKKVKKVSEKQPNKVIDKLEDVPHIINEKKKISKSKTKRKPGRPRKTPNKAPLEKRGIVNSPEYPEHVIELLYDKPMIFSKIISLFRTMSVKEVHFVFMKRQVKILTIDHHNKNKIEIILDCSKVNHYYCGEPTTEVLVREHLEKIAKTIKKDNTSISFTVAEETKNMELSITIKNNMKIDGNRRLTRMEAKETYDFDFGDYKNFPIRFTLPAKYFKKLLTDVTTFNDNLHIRKNGEGPLCFVYDSVTENISSRDIVTDPSTIKLVTTLGPNDIFNVKLKAKYIAPLAKSLIAESINIYASDESGVGVVFTADLDMEGVLKLRIKTHAELN